jgi:hypothetical protein
MSLRWRWSLVVILAAVVLGSLLPQTFLKGSLSTATMAAVAPTGPPTFPSGCAGASCSRSTPIPAAPVLAIAGMAAAATLVLGAAAGYRSRRIRSQRVTLPRGIVSALFHPPRFS